MSSYSSIRDAIVARVNTIANIGKVYGYTRQVADWSAYLNLFTSTIGGVKQVRGWEVSWDGVPETDADMGRFGGSIETYSFTIRGKQGLDDSAATEQTFDDLIEAIRSDLRSQSNLGVLAVHVGSIQVTVPVIDNRQFGSVLCHFCEINVRMHVDSDLT